MQEIKLNKEIAENLKMCKEFCEMQKAKELRESYTVQEIFKTPKDFRIGTIFKVKGCYFMKVVAHDGEFDYIDIETGLSMSGFDEHFDAYAAEPVEEIRLTRY